ncbi:MAG: 50S ribosomal protein L15 [Thermoplasmata archaeon]|nr:MAG: 50S ribosomal protein L15 [Thermoplasmata archaeon]
MGRTEKHRGSRTYGRGKKAGRGAGKRGGRGNAGLHKHKYITTVKNDPKHFGRYGFKRPRPPSERERSTINVGQLEDRMGSFLKKGFAKKVGSTIEVDLSSAGIDKLLGAGKLKKPLKIKVMHASKLAKSKVESAGGSLLLSEDEVREEKTSEAE